MSWNVLIQELKDAGPLSADEVTAMLIRLEALAEAEGFDYWEFRSIDGNITTRTGGSTKQGSKRIIG